jgi:hypothetical protein
MNNSEKIILDLCGGTGAWSRPYQEAGYDVRIITLPEQDVRYYKPPRWVYGILAAPPCTDFSISGVRWWKSKDKEKGLMESLSVVAACLRIIEKAKPVFWALENPVGRLKTYIGKYRYTFQPYEYGDPWTKRTCIWGEHNIPVKVPVMIDNSMQYLSGSPDKTILSFIGGTPSGKLGLVDHPEYIYRHKESLDKKEILSERFPELRNAGMTRAELRSITPPDLPERFMKQINRLKRLDSEIWHAKRTIKS